MLANAFKFLLVAAAASQSMAAPLEPRAVINHDAVVGFPETVPGGPIGANLLRFKPWLKVFSGCVPFPAVDANGNTGGGLKPTGGSSSGCSKNLGQVYARAGQYDGRWALMYSWYMPKDSPSPGLGHRHDWENCVVWIDDATSASPNIVAMAASGHGGYDRTSGPFALDGTRPKIRYFSNWPLNHQLGFTDVEGGEQPLVAWESLTDAARNALSTADFGSAGVPFKDDSFMNNLAKA
ncbi:hypothetical protein RB595_004924 [Gaeumannomyces hyphopodioides]